MSGFNVRPPNQPRNSKNSPTNSPGPGSGDSFNRGRNQKPFFNGPTYSERQGPSGQPPRTVPPKATPTPKTPSPPGGGLKPPGGGLNSSGGFISSPGAKLGQALLGLYLGNEAGKFFNENLLGQAPDIASEQQEQDALRARPTPFLDATAPAYNNPPVMGFNPGNLQAGVYYRVEWDGIRPYPPYNVPWSVAYNGGMYPFFTCLGPFSIVRTPVGSQGDVRINYQISNGNLASPHSNGQTTECPGERSGLSTSHILSGSFSIKRIQRLDTNQNVPPDVSPPDRAPRYTINNNYTTNNNISAPPAPSPTPTNPIPLGTPPNKSPGYAPFSKPTPNNPNEKDKEKEDLKVPLFNPLGGGYSPIGSPYPPPVVTNQTVNDPLINAAREVDPNFGLKTNNSSRTTSGGGAGGTTTTTTTTTPTVPSDPFKVTPFIPPFFNPVSPIDPTKQKPFDDENKTPPPPDQTPAGNNCCVPTPVSQGLNDANRKLDALTPLSQLADFTVLQVINAKLGPQVPGGLSGFLGEKFTKLWKSRTVDRALNLMATAAAIHNAVMLSRNIGGTLVQALQNVLAIIGIKDADDVTSSFSEAIGDSIENIIKGIIGAAN